jgi:hypothetical protein
LPTAYGLCTTYQRVLTHGTGSQKAVAFHNLAKAAGGTGKVAAWCAAVAHSRHSPPGPQPTRHHGEPRARQRSPHRAEPPHRTGPPSARSSPRPTGAPHTPKPSTARGGRSWS